MSTYCPTVIMDDFSIDMLGRNSTQPHELKIFMNHYSMDFMTICVTHINHIWTNAPIQQCMLEIVEAY
jgi:hypothetical protein